jgi:prepilin-type processing-associated H-X9-DG protein
VLLIGCGTLFVGSAILAAILFPVFAQAREKARTTSCLNNEKQIGLAIARYCQDYDEKYPPHHNAKLNWAEEVMPCIRNTQVFVCPSDPSGASVGYLDRNVPERGETLLSISEPALLAMAADGDAKGIAKRHLNDGFNLLFCDGHARLITGSASSSSYHGLDHLGAPVQLAPGRPPF